MTSFCVVENYHIDDFIILECHAVMFVTRNCSQLASGRTADLRFLVSSSHKMG